MKKTLILLSLFALACAGSAAFAAPDATADLYKSRCAGCHGADGSKTMGGSAAIKGMPVESVVAKLNGYADGTYGGRLKQTMVNPATKLSADERRALAEYISKL